MLSVEELEDKLIDLAFAEDIGDGDHTTLCCIPDEAQGQSHLLIKEEGVLAGVEMAKKVFARFDPSLRVNVLIEDGAEVKPGDIAMIVSRSEEHTSELQSRQYLACRLLLEKK